MELKEQKDNVIWVIDYILQTLKYVDDKVNTVAVLDALAGLNETKWELEGLIEERELTARKQAQTT